MKTKIFTFAAAAFLLNFFWESWHAVYLYQGHQGHEFLIFPVKNYLSLITYASIMDALMLTLVLFVGVLFWRSALWYQQMNQRKLFYFIAATLSLAVFVEIKGVYLLLEWSYGAAMPMIFGLGLSPLLQLPTTGLIALWCARRFTV